MRRSWIIVITGFIALMSASAVWAADAGAGRAVYDRLCLGCHGPSGQGASGPALNTAVFAKKFDSAAKLRDITRKGAPGMPAYGTELITDPDMDNLLAYMMSLLPAPAPAPAATAAVAAPAPTAATTSAPVAAPVIQEEPETTKSSLILPLEQLYAIAVLLVVLLNVAIMAGAWWLVNRKPA